MTTAPELNTIDRYMLEGGMEAAARRGVAVARADLMARDSVPHDETNIPNVMFSKAAESALVPSVSIDRLEFVRKRPA